MIVTDGAHRAALAVVRSLGRAGYSVHVCADQVPSLAGASRYAISEHRVPEALGSPELHANAVAERIRDTDAAVLIPITEASLLALLRRRTTFAGVRVPFPDIGRFSRISDKAAVLKVGSEIGLRVPAQRLVPQRVDFSEEVSDSLTFPVVLKPIRSVAGRENRRIQLGVSYATSRRELEARVCDLPDAAFPLLVQQRILGPGVGTFLLLWHGELLAAFAHRRIREKPPSGGVSVYRESVAADPELITQSRRLLEAFDWQGVAMVEFKIDASTGEPYLMEVNGRFWGSLQLAVDAGVDFPALLAAAALDRMPPPVTSYRTGVRSRWWWGDIDQLLMRFRRSPAELSLPPGAPGRWRALADALVLWRPGDRSEVFRLSDPRPFFRESADWLRAVRNA